MTRLCRTDDDFDASTLDYRLITDGSDLVVIRRTSVWSSKEMIAIPSEEKYTQAAAYAEASSGETLQSATVHADGNALDAVYRGIWSRKTADDWISGHRPIFQYYARGNGPASIRDGSLGVTHDDTCTYDFGGSRSSLKFDVFALPTNSTSFKAYLRIWNPSWCYCAGTDQGAHLSRAQCPTGSHNSTCMLRYHFDSSRQLPDAIEATNYGECDFGTHANNGTGSDSGVQYASLFDCWGSTHGNWTSFNLLQRTAVFMKGVDSTTQDYDRSAYYYDHEITGNALTQLKHCLRNKSVYLTAGFHAANGISTGASNCMPIDTTATAYASRIELRFVISGSKLNT